MLRTKEYVRHDYLCHGDHGPFGCLEIIRKMPSQQQKQMIATWALACSETGLTSVAGGETLRA